MLKKEMEAETYYIIVCKLYYSRMKVPIFCLFLITPHTQNIIEPLIPDSFL